MSDYRSDWEKQKAIITEVLTEDPGLVDYLEYEESLPFPVVHLASLFQGERRWGFDQTEIYVYKESDGKARYFGVNWYKLTGDAEGEAEWSIDAVEPVVETTVRWELIA